MNNMILDNHYEATILLDLRGCHDSMESAISRLTEVIKNIGCVVNNVNQMGQFNFTRSVDRNFSKGLYVNINFTGSGDAPLKLKRKLKAGFHVNRLFIKKSKLL